MPGRRHSEDDAPATGAKLAVAAPRALGHGCLIAAGAMVVAAALGLSTTLGPGTFAAALTLGMGCWFAADAIGDTALLADAERRHRAAEEQYREDAATLDLERKMAGLGATEAQPERQEPARHFVALIESRREHEAAGKGR